jgi:hypothetical protein
MTPKLALDTNCDGTTHQYRRELKMAKSHVRRARCLVVHSSQLGMPCDPGQEFSMITALNWQNWDFKRFFTQLLLLNDLRPRHPLQRMRCQCRAAERNR